MKDKLEKTQKVALSAAALAALSAILIYLITGTTDPSYSQDPELVITPAMAAIGLSSNRVESEQATLSENSDLTDLQPSSTHEDSERLQIVEQKARAAGLALEKARANFIESNPEIRRWEFQFTQTVKRKSELERASEAKTLEEWLRKKSNETPEEAQTRADKISKVRQLMILEEIDNLLKTPETSEPVRQWLNNQMNELNSLRSTDQRRFKYLEAALTKGIDTAALPALDILAKFIAALNRDQLISDFRARTAIESDIHSLPAGSTDYLRDSVRLSAWQYATGTMVESRLPSEIRHLRDEKEKLHSELKELQFSKVKQLKVR